MQKTTGYLTANVGTSGYNNIDNVRFFVNKIKQTNRASIISYHDCAMKLDG